MSKFQERAERRLVLNLRIVGSYHALSLGQLPKIYDNESLVRSPLEENTP